MNRPLTYLLGSETVPATVPIALAMASGVGLLVGIHVLFLTLFKR